MLPTELSELSTLLHDRSSYTLVQSNLRGQKLVDAIRDAFTEMQKQLHDVQENERAVSAQLVLLTTSSPL